MNFFNSGAAFIYEQIRKKETSGGASEGHTLLAMQKLFCFKVLKKDIRTFTLFFSKPAVHSRPKFYPLLFWDTCAHTRLHLCISVIYIKVNPLGAMRNLHYI